VPPGGTIETMEIPEPTDAVRGIAHALEAAGHDAVLVGGAVRDALLGAETHDWDLVTDASTAELRSLASGVPGIRSVYDIGERFGTLGMALEDGSVLEVSRYRSDARAAPTPAERFAIDAGHRDFTINAIGYDLASAAVLDPVRGRADLEARLLRAPGVPRERFAEDPVRVLRAARFVAELDFGLEPETAEAMSEAPPRLGEVAVERVRDELTKLLVGAYAPAGLRVLRQSGALRIVLPEVAVLEGVSQPTFHDLDALDHTVEAVGLAPATPVLRWATLLHDIGKAPTRSVEPDGRIRFFKHARVGADIAREICGRLRFSTADTAAVVHLVAEHMRLGDVDFDSSSSVDRAVRKLDMYADPSGKRALVTAEDAVELTLADFAATAHRDEAPVLGALLRDAVAASRERGTRRAIVSPISGQDIMRTFGLAEGPAVGVAKRAVEAAIGRGELAADDVHRAYDIAEAALAEAGTAGSPRGPGVAE